MWTISSDRHVNKILGKTSKADHPTIKPLALIERIVLASSNPGDVVLDIFAGSGTTLVAAAKNDRKFIGIDSNEAYVKIAQKRIKELK